MDDDRTDIKDNRYPVPDGFRQLLEALAREVLRGQPNDIYQFSSLFFKILLDLREELDGTSPLQKPELYDKFKRRLFATAIEEGLVSSTILSSFQRSSGGKASANRTIKEITGAREDLFGVEPGRRASYQWDGNGDRAAAKIQANVRGYLTRKHLKGRKRTTSGHVPTRPTTLEDKAAEKIQAGFKGFITRKQLAADGYPVKTSTSRSTRSPISGHNSSPGSPSFDSDFAASKIQAGIRGYLTRKELAARGMPVHSPSRHSHSISLQKLDMSADPNADEAAAKIQAGIRGFLTRKQLEKEGLRKSPLRNINRYENRRVTIADVDEAATKIQAGIRGFLTRKRLVRGQSGGASPTSCTSPTGPGGFMAGQQYNHVGDDGIESSGDAEEAAATKIQAAFRGHKIRQQYQHGKHDYNDQEDWD